MRRGMDNGFLELSDKYVGINLGADYCSEHEWGIKGIKQTLGIPDPGIIHGIKGRTVTIFPQDKMFYDSRKTHTCLTMERNHHRLLGWENYELDQNPKELATAWDENTFGIVVSNTYKDKLLLLKEAFEKKDVAIWLGGGGVFQNAGLVVAIASLLPDEIDKTWTQMDLDRLKLKKAFNDSGIERILDAAGKKYFALSPRWANEEKTELTFWLNPYDQRNNNFGWFNIKDLIEWSINTGPIPKN
jgi:hypothetical protein